MDYHLENLGADRFQQLCQALLVKQFPDLLCLPVGQPDGGRDALTYFGEPRAGGFLVYQVKFVKRPLAEPDPHKWLTEIVKGEALKIKNLIPRGAKHYYLLTNVPGTAHLDTGSIDKVHHILGSMIEIPADCWWRDDLCRRLDHCSELRWAYPELMTGMDLLRLLVEEGLSESRERRMSALKACLRDQYELDKEVRFKQVELQNKLLDLFIDVPLIVRDIDHRKFRRIYFGIMHRLLSQPTDPDDIDPVSSRVLYEREERPSIGGCVFSTGPTSSGAPTYYRS